MGNGDLIPEARLAVLIFDIVKMIDTSGYVNLGDSAFDQLSCSKLRLYRVAKNHCHKYGYEYQPILYKSSRAHYRRPFDRVPDEQKAHFSKPGLQKVNPS